jgi:hypothetical protein
MDQKHIVVFSSHSIFTEGVVNRLRQSPFRAEAYFIDPKDDFLQKVADIQPSTVIIENGDGTKSDCCLLCELLNEFSNLTIIRLKVQEQDVQVISSSALNFDSVQDLVQIIGE